MPYPLVIAPTGQHIMRINHDASLSVLWDKVINERYKPLTELNYAVVKVCEVLLAARDNFSAESWHVSNSWAEQWDHLTITIDYLDRPVPKGTDRFAVMTFQDSGPIHIARVTYAGDWMFRWPLVIDLAHQQPEASGVALVGFCRLLKAARDRFRTKPWSEEEAED